MEKKNKTDVPFSDLNKIIAQINPESNKKSFAKKWIKVQIGRYEVYVGDRAYVVTLVDTPASDNEEMMKNNLIAEEFVTRYLEDEDFVENEWIYLGLQRFSKNYPEE